VEAVQVMTAVVVVHMEINRHTLGQHWAGCAATSAMHLSTGISARELGTAGVGACCLRCLAAQSCSVVLTGRRMILAHGLVHVSKGKTTTSQMMRWEGQVKMT
jgi:hypothetical protein